MRKWILGPTAKEGFQRDHVGLGNHHTKGEWAAFTEPFVRNPMQRGASCAG